MRILLAGATGFLGSHVLRRLLADARQEIAILVRPTCDPWRIAELLGRVRRMDGDLRDPGTFAGALADFTPQVIIHLAWDGVGGRDRNDLKQVHNLHDSVQLLTLAARHGAAHWLTLGSQAEYGPRGDRTAEDAPTQPTTLYGATKLATSLILRQLCGQLGLRFAWLRLFAAYGEMDDPEWLIPYVILRLLRRERPVLTAGTQRWDYLYAADAAAAVCAVAAHPQASGTFNLGSGQAYTVRSIVEKVRDLIDPALPLGFGEVPFRPDQIMHLEADIGRLQREVGWSPQVPLDDGLARTVQWYREQRQRYEH